MTDQPDTDAPPPDPIDDEDEHLDDGEALPPRVVMPVQDDGR